MTNSYPEWPTSKKSDQLDRFRKVSPMGKVYIVELQWLEHLWNHENIFETKVVRANEC